MTSQNSTIARWQADSEDPGEAGRAEPGQDLAALFGQSVIELDIRPRVITDSGAKVMWSSPSAVRMMRSPYPVYLRNRRLCFEDGPATQDGDAFLASLGSERRRLMLASREDCWVLVTGWARQVDGRRRLFLTFSLSEPTLDCVQSGLAQHFGLTRAEAAVLDQFARLRTPNEIADALNLKINTVRSHLKRLHAKLSVNANTRMLQIVRVFGDS